MHEIDIYPRGTTVRALYLLALVYGVWPLLWRVLLGFALATLIAGLDGAQW